jgi:hypothetical protein
VSYHNEIPEADTLEYLMDQIWTALLCGDTLFVYPILGNYGCFTITEHVLDVLYTLKNLSAVLQNPEESLTLDCDLARHHPSLFPFDCGD